MSEGYRRDDSHIQAILQQAAASEDYAAGIKVDTALELKRPFYLLRPKVFKDGNQWVCLYGDNLQDGVCGVGNTPDLATRDFDKNWMCLPDVKRDGI